MIPKILKPAAHRLMDAFLAVFQLNLPHYFNLKTKLRYLVRGIDEPDIQYIAERYIKLGDHVIDVGANIGLTARAFAKAVGSDGEVHAIEPERSNFNYLCANSLSWPQIIPHRLAFSVNEGYQKLYLNPVSGTGNSIYGNSSHSSQIVKCLTLDRFIEQEAIQRIDWIKIDVEGAELDVLEGMRSIIQQQPDIRLLIEYCPSNLERAGTSAGALIDKLNELGFNADVILATAGSFRLESTNDPSELLGQKNYLNLICSKKNVDRAKETRD